MQKPISKTFEFFELMHLIVNDNILLIKLWLLGNKEMQYLMENYLQSLALDNKSLINWLLIKFKNIEYLQVCKIIIEYLQVCKIIEYPKLIKFLDLGFYEIKDNEIELLPKTLIYLKANATKLTNSIDLLQNLTSLSLYYCKNFTVNFLNNLSYKITTLKLYHLKIVNFKLKYLVNLISLELEFGQIETFVLENCLDLETLSLYSNKLIEFPQSILKITNLELLDLRWNSISRIPNELSQLKNLKHLNLGLNKLTEFPTVIFTLSKLKTLKLDSNKISKVFILDSKLENLETLYLSDNCIDEIHLQLPKLKFLDLTKNKKIVNVNLQTPNLKTLYIVNNDYGAVYNIITSLPKSTKIYS